MNNTEWLQLNLLINVLGHDWNIWITADKFNVKLSEINFNKREIFFLSVSRCFTQSSNISIKTELGWNFIETELFTVDTESYEEIWCSVEKQTTTARLRIQLASAKESKLLKQNKKVESEKIKSVKTRT